MSQENVEVVRRFNEPYEGQDIMPVIREAIGRLGPDPQVGAVLALWAEDPGWKQVHPDIEWDMSAVGMGVAPARGPREVVAWLVDWVEGWESYIYRVVEYRDLGDWVLTQTDLRARGRGGIPVEMHTFVLWRVRDGKIAVYRVFPSEAEALEAAGLSE